MIILVFGLLIRSGLYTFSILLKWGDLRITVALVDVRVEARLVIPELAEIQPPT